jgi:serine/threonine protein kinase
MPVIEVLREGGEVVVEKRLAPRDLREAEAVRALRAEGALYRALGGTFTPRLVEAGDDARGPFVRTAKVPFATLAERLGTTADVAFVELVTRTALIALASLHEACDDEGALDVVHADLSPANIAASHDGAQVVLLDLGLAVFRESPPRDGAFRGTPLYCAPEVARGDTPTTRSDLFALAATLLHVATGEPPRAERSLAALIGAAAEHPVLDPRRASLASRGPGHAAIVACLAHDPDERPASAREVLSRLHRLR